MTIQGVWLYFRTGRSIRKEDYNSYQTSFTSLSSSSCPFLLPFPHVNSLSSFSLILPFHISGHFLFLLSFHPPSFCFSNRPPSGLLSLHSSLSFPVYSLSSFSSLPCSKPLIRRGQKYFSLATSETGATREGWEEKQTVLDIFLSPLFFYPWTFKDWDIWYQSLQLSLCFTLPYKISQWVWTLTILHPHIISVPFIFFFMVLVFSPFTFFWVDLDLHQKIKDKRELQENHERPAQGQTNGPILKNL